METSTHGYGVVTERPACEAATVAFEEVPLERLECEITELAAHLAAAECRWLLMVAEFDRRGGWHLGVPQLRPLAQLEVLDRPRSCP